ncbi:hypothetical protein [Mangrovibacter yixingensis]|uniref:hypothetical protein n=1 Tax=Mangrovibacter yixingensis TaxID=1529639 RepID=UPI001CFA4BEE|nr:hypothetical protein [Mangrovibacter yixingensis]
MSNQTQSIHELRGFKAGVKAFESGDKKPKDPASLYKQATDQKSKNDYTVGFNDGWFNAQQNKSQKKKESRKVDNTVSYSHQQQSTVMSTQQSEALKRALEQEAARHVALNSQRAF